MFDLLFDHTARTAAVEKLWEKTQPFERLKERNASGEVFSFLDGPMTANNRMGVHHAWGRTLKDVYQRYMGMQGYRQRYQNGYDCQGLWVEVEVEKQLGLGVKTGVMDYGLEAFNEACRERVAHFAKVQEEQSRALGQWMNWDESYYTMSDANVEYNWRFLARCQELGLLHRDFRPTAWCPRCQTSLSAHEQADSHRQMEDPSLWLYMPGADGTALLTWTTQPWSLLGHSAVAAHPEAVYNLVEHAGRQVWAKAGLLGGDVLSSCTGAELAGYSYEAPYTGQCAVVADRRVGEEGSGLVCVSPACGQMDYELALDHGLDYELVLDEAGQMLSGPFSAVHWRKASEAVMDDMSSRDLVHKRTTLMHAYPTCWRCQEPVVHRLSREWYLRADPVRERMLAANETVTWTPASSGKRMTDWLTNMGDWCVSRRRYWGLPLPFYPCNACDSVLVVRDRDHLREVAVDPELVDGVAHLHRPYVDDVLVHCPGCSAHLSRVAEVGDCWLDAAVVPFSTLGFDMDEPYVHSNGAAQGLSNARSAGHSEWQEHYPADLVVEMHEQVRLWFYSMLYVSTVLTDTAPYKSVVTYDKVGDAAGAAMHKSCGNAVDLDEVLSSHGPDALRWFFMNQPLGRMLKFDVDEVAKSWRVMHTLGHAARMCLEHEPSNEASNAPLDEWLSARTRLMACEARTALDAYRPAAYAASLSGWAADFSQVYVRANRARLQAGQSQAARQSLSVFARTLAPVCPHYAEQLWQMLDDDSVHLQPMPEEQALPADTQMLEGFAKARLAVHELSRLRSQAGHPLRQPLRSATVPADVDQMWYPYVLAESNVHSVGVGDEYELDAELDDDLRCQGQLRTLLRAYMQSRKEMGMQPGNPATLHLHALGSFGEYLQGLDENVWGDAFAHVVWSEEPRGSQVKVAGAEVWMQVA